MGRTEEEEEPGSETGKRKRKYRVVVHSSPFLRCVQTAIAVSAGILQVRAGDVTRRSSALVENNNVLAQSVTQDEPAGVAGSPATSKKCGKTLLRLDAFLGEWLTPDYFEFITPPPGSVMMLASAKGELLRRGETVEMSPPTPSRASLGYFPGGWNPPSLNSSFADEADKPVQATSETADVLTSTRTRSGSYDIAARTAPRFGGQVLSRLSTAISSDPGAYMPPTPTYAISPSDPIPVGYVAHARDSCVNIDYQWDSMRDPRNWGNGGEYGEEWSTMHRRFRTGLSKMVNWYKSNDATLNKVSDSKEDDEEDAETVLVLITHGAGCNALIGALTNRPALVDVGTSSLTMAVRKENPPDNKLDGSTVEVADEYEVKHVASNDHLRMSPSPFQGQSRQPSPRTFTNPTPSHRRFGSISGPVVTNSNGAGGLSFSDSIRNLGTRRISHAPSRSMFTNRSSSGLWGSTSTSEDADDLIPNFGDPSPAQKPSTTAGADQSTQPTPLPPNRGLWNGSSANAQDRDSGIKRRWTVVDRTL